MLAKQITFPYPRNGCCAINIDFQGTEYIIEWNGNWREIPDLTTFPLVENATITLVPHTSSVDEIWTNSSVLNFGGDSHLRSLHSCPDEFSVCKVAINDRQRTLIRDEFLILQQLQSQDAPVVRTYRKPLIDEHGIFGFRMEKLEFVDVKDASKHILPLTESVDAIHRAGVVHHDLSPNNIMLNQQGLIRIIDFGRAGYAGTKIPKNKLIGRELATTFSVDSDLVTLKETIGIQILTKIIAY